MKLLIYETVCSLLLENITKNVLAMSSHIEWKTTLNYFPSSFQL